MLSSWRGRSNAFRPRLQILNLEDRSVPAAFSAGNLVVYRVGDGSAALSSAATAAFLDEYTPTGTLVQTIAMPTADNGANQILTNAGTSTSEGLLTRSSDGFYLHFGGYDAAVGTANVAGTSTTGGTPVVRVMGRVGANGIVDTSTTTTFFSGGNIRSVGSVDGSNLWAAGSTTGVVHQPLGSTGAGTVVSNTFTNTRVVSAVNGQLYLSAGAGTLRLGTVGTGAPTSAGNTTTNLPGLPTASYSPYGFFFADLSPSVAGVDTVYIAADDVDRIRKYTFDGSTWAQTGETANVSGGDYRGLTGTVSGSTVTLYATAGAAANTIVSVTDATGYNGTLSGTPTLVLTGATNTALRGIAMTPEAPPNNSPTLNGANNFTAIDEDDTANTGTLISGLISGQITDPDSGAFKGIAVTAIDASNGTWEYTLNGGSTWTNVGTVSAAQSLLLTDNANTRLRFVPNANYNGTISPAVTFRAWDQTSGAPGTKVDTTTNGGTTAFSTAEASPVLTVNAINDVPVNTVPGAQPIALGATYSFTTLAVADADAASGDLQVTLSADVGTISLGSTTGLDFTVGDGLNDATMTFTGTLAEINAALATAQYTAPNTATTATFTITTNDQGNSDGAPESDTDTVTFFVTNQQNQAPVNSVPAAQAIDEDTTLTFNTANSNLISISDADAGTSSVQVTLTAVGGLLTLSGTTGLTFSTGDGLGDATLTMTGTLTDINAALDGLQYATLPNFNGPGSIDIVTDDLGNFGLGGPQSDTDTVAITVNPINDGPVNTVPGTINTYANGTLAFTGLRAISIADVDAGTAEVQVTLSVDAGSLTLGTTTGLTFSSGTGSADTSMTFTGTVAAINTALASLTFATPSSDTAVTLTLTTNDQGNFGTGGALSDTDTVTMNVFDAPQLSEMHYNPPGTDAPNEYVELKGTPNATIPSGYYLIGIEGEAGTAAGDVQTIFNLGGQTFGSNGYLVLLQNTNTYTVDASATTLTSSSAGFGGLPSSMFSADGGTDIEQPTATFLIVKASSAPTLADDIDSNNDGLPDGSVYAGWTVLDGIGVVTTAAGTAYAPLVFSSVANPVTASSNVVVNVGTSAPTYIARTGDNIGLGVNDWVAGTTTGTAPNFTIVGGTAAPVGFGGDALNHIGSANFPGGPFNNDPVNTVPAADININEDTSITLNGANLFAIADVDAGVSTVQVTLTAANGAVTLNGTAGLTFLTGDGTDDPLVTMQGTVTAINAALNGMIYTPALHFNGPTTLQIDTDDLGSNGADGPKTDTDSVNINVAALNDAPVGTPGSLTHFAGESHTFTLTDFGFTDPNDTPENVFFAVKITTLPGVGSLKLNGTPISVGDTILATDIAANLFTFTSNIGEAGFPAGSFMFQVQDDGGTLGGGIDLDPTPQSFTINIDVPNVAPTGADGSVTTNEDVPYTFAVGDFGFDDSTDPVADTLLAVKITTLPTQGTLKLNNVAVTVGQSIAVADIIAGKLTFNATLTNDNGSPYTNFTFQVQDAGGTVNSGVDLDPTPNTLTINILSVNDAPSGEDATFTLEGDTTKALGAAMFDYVDPDATVGTTYSIVITTLPALGTLKLNNAAVTVGQAISLVDIENNLLTYTPVIGGVGSPYTTFTFQIQDGDGIANGGADIDPTPNTITINVTPPNATPVLQPGNVYLKPVARNSVNNAGQTVASFLGDRITDADANALEGIAITLADNLPARGQWQYSLDNGVTWTGFNGTPITSAVLLRATDLIRFEPATGFEGQATFDFSAWDQTSGNAGDSLDLTNGADSVSAQQATAIVFVGIPLPNTLEDAKAPTATPVSTLLFGVFNDVDLKPKSGIAITNITGQEFGVWQYNLGGWKTMNPSPTNALLLASNTKIRFKSFTDALGSPTFAFRAWDQTSGKAGMSADATVNGDGTAFSAQELTAFTTITPVNDIPVLDVSGVPPLTNAANGNLVSDLLGTTVTDPDGPMLKMAVTTASGKGGVWEYSTDGGTNWLIVSPVSGKAPRLLNPTDRIRYRSLLGAGSGKLAYKAFDGLAFSKASETGTLIIGAAVPPANTAPVLNTAPAVNFAAILEDTQPLGDLVSSLLGSAVTDPDTGAKRGLAIVGLTGTTDGVWQYSANGKSWKPIGSVSATSALLLRDTDRVRFLPNKNFHGTATMSYHAWDQTRGGFGFRANPTLGTGGSSSLSADVETATATVTPVHDGPVVNKKFKQVLKSVLPTDTDPVGQPVQPILFASTTFTDPGTGLTMVITATTGAGAWEYSTDGGTTWDAVGAVSDATPKLIDGFDWLRFLPTPNVSGVASLTYKVNDGLATSVDAVTATLNVNATDDRPVLNAKVKPALIPTTKNNTSPDGTLVSALLGSLATDDDPNANLGIAITSTDSKNGTWEYSTDGGTTWDAVGLVSGKAPRFLTSTTLVRFKPNAIFTGVASFKFKAWDSASVDPNGPLALSAATGTATVNVNTAPTLV